MIDRTLFPVAPLDLEERQASALIGLRALANADGLVSPRAREQVYEASRLSRSQWRAALPMLVGKGLVSRLEPEAYGRPERYQLSEEARTAPIGSAIGLPIGSTQSQPMGQPDFNPTSTQPLPSSLIPSSLGNAKPKGRKEGSAADRVGDPVNPTPTQSSNPIVASPVQVNLPWDPREAIELLETLLAGYRSRVEAKAESPKAAVSEKGPSKEKSAEPAPKQPRKGRPPLVTKDRNGWTGHDACKPLCRRDRKHGHYGPRFNHPDREWFGCCATCGDTYDLATEEAIAVNARRDEKPKPTARASSLGPIGLDVAAIVRGAL
jgi:hypothetical protein